MPSSHFTSPKPATNHLSLRTTRAEFEPLSSKERKLGVKSHYLHRLDERMSAEPVVTVPEAAKILGVAPRTVYRHLSIGSLEHLHRRGRRFVTKRSIALFLEERYGPTERLNLLQEVWGS